MEHVEDPSEEEIEYCTPPEIQRKTFRLICYRKNQEANTSFSRSDSSSRSERTCFTARDKISGK
jgi:hypothetical protein